VIELHRQTGTYLMKTAPTVSLFHNFSLYLAFQAARWSAQAATAENQTP